MKRLTTTQDIDAYMYQLNEMIQVPENTKLIVKLTESEYDNVLKTIGNTNFNNGAGMIYNTPTGNSVIIQKIKNKSMTENNIKVKAPIRPAIKLEYSYVYNDPTTSYRECTYLYNDYPYDSSVIQLSGIHTEYDDAAFDIQMTINKERLDKLIADGKEIVLKKETAYEGKLSV